MSTITWVRDGQPVCSGGDVGGDVQVSDSLVVRSLPVRTPDGTGEWSLITVNVYAASRAGQYNVPPFGVDVQVELTICFDSARPADSELWADAVYLRACGGRTWRNTADAEHAAVLLACDLAAGRKPFPEIGWDGKRGYQHTGREQVVS